MTGYTVNTGTSVKFAEGWDNVFGGSSKRATKKKGTATKKSGAKKKSAKKVCRKK